VTSLAALLVARLAALLAVSLAARFAALLAVSLAALLAACLAVLGEWQSARCAFSRANQA
jgi:hypothetical protein